MRRWCNEIDRGITNPGEFKELQLKTLSGESLHSTNELLDELAQRIMSRYESTAQAEPLEIDASSLEPPDRTIEFYHWLLNPDGSYTERFEPFAGEIFAHWYETTFGTPVYAELGKINNSDPVWDMLSIYEADDGAYLRVIQVKTTNGYLRDNCNKALAKFEQLDKTKRYHADLYASLRLIEDKKVLPPHIRGRDVGRMLRYWVTAVHSEPRHSVQPLATYRDKISGSYERRGALFIEAAWPDFWKQIAKRIYDKLDR